jgi:CrcB protein
LVGKHVRAKIVPLLIRCLLVLAGGAVGSLTRYLVALAINERYDGRFPLATFLINVTGSFIIGLLLVLLDRKDLLHPNLRPLLVTGFLGGYTTFSTFEWELLALGRSAPPMAVLYGLSSVVVGVLACWAGASLARR